MTVHEEHCPVKTFGLEMTSNNRMQEDRSTNRRPRPCRLKTPCLLQDPACLITPIELH